MNEGDHPDPDWWQTQKAKPGHGLTAQGETRECARRNNTRMDLEVGDHKSQVIVHGPTYRKLANALQDLFR
jgi:hypothetical protein